MVRFRFRVGVGVGVGVGVAVAVGVGRRALAAVDADGRVEERAAPQDGVLGARDGLDRLAWLGLG